MIPSTLWWLSCRLYRAHLGVLARLIKAANFLVFHAVLPYQATVERDVKLMHQGLGVVAHPNVTIGHRVVIYNHVTLGSETWIGSPYRIVIGDDAMIGSGAKIIAKREQTLVVGAGSRVGANAVVTKDVPPGVTVVGVPARPVESATRAEIDA